MPIAASQGNGFGDVYHIIWFLPNDRGVGEVRNYASDLRRYRRIGISLGDDILKKMNKRCLMTDWTARGPRILVSRTFMKIPRSLREAGIWHEVGHIHYGHHSIEKVGERTECRTFPSAGGGHETQQTMEVAADRFAVLQSSKEALRGFLQYLLRARASGGGPGLDEAERRDLQARIASIRVF